MDAFRTVTANYTPLANRCRTGWAKAAVQDLLVAAGCKGMVNGMVIMFVKAKRPVS